MTTLRFEPGASTHEDKRKCRDFYDEVSRQLDASQFGDAAYFLNYGYVPNGAPEAAVVTLPRRSLNKNSKKLMLEVIGSAAVTGHRVLDVGCGRGGMIHVLTSYFSPALAIGIDQAERAVRFCTTAHRRDGVGFTQADAERLPFADAAFDVVTNVESSHHYPDIAAFYAEVHRVLRLDGAFLYADVMPGSRRDSDLLALTRIGFAVEQTRDISANVLLSCDEIAPSRVEAFDAAANRTVIDDFLAVPGSTVYERLKHRDWTFEIWTLRKAL